MLRQIHVTNPQSLVTGYCSRMLTLTSVMNSWSCSFCSNSKTYKKIHLWSPRKKHLLKNDRLVGFSSGVYFNDSSRDYGVITASARRFSTSNSQIVDEGNDKNLPWLATYKAKDEKKAEKVVTTKPRRSSWEESADRFLKGGDDRGRRMDGRPVDRTVNDERIEDEEEEEEEDIEPIDDPRWYKIKDRVDRVVESKPGFERPEFKRWNKQESWGRKTWKYATESTLPKLGGVGVYGVGPVLAALSAGRREFYALYIQEGLSLGGNIKKKKDKKGFEKILRMASKMGLRTKEVSKHDLNMITDNRPHQGLVLDASPLELVGIKELEPASVTEEYGSLWLALDEVTDPQNLGAIIRSAYFFGASGVVLCAKNSAPLSGVVSKSSAGSLEVMELRSCKNMMQFLTSSAKNGWRVLGGSVTSTSVPLNEVVPGAPTILVLGSEGTGLRPLVERCCNQLIKIPGNTPVSLLAGDDENEERSGETTVQELKSFLAVESLNVSVAAGVLLHHLIGTTISHNDM